jgi:hypothetical protein
MIPVSKTKVFQAMKEVERVPATTYVIGSNHLHEAVKPFKIHCDTCGKLIYDGDVIDAEVLLNHPQAKLAVNHTALLVVPISEIHTIVDEGVIQNKERCNSCVATRKYILN